MHGDPKTLSKSIIWFLKQNQSQTTQAGQQQLKAILQIISSNIENVLGNTDPGRNILPIMILSDGVYRHRFILINQAKEKFSL
jgi:hypothetical protein